MKWLYAVLFCVIFSCLLKTLSCLPFSSIGGHSEQESTLNQLLVEMDGELNTLYTADLVLSTGLII